MEWGELVNMEIEMVVVFVVALGVIFANAVVAMAAAMRADRFCWSLLPEFLADDIAPYGVALIGLGLGAIFAPPLLAVYYAAAASIVIGHIDKIQMHLAELNVDATQE